MQYLDGVDSGQPGTLIFYKWLQAELREAVPELFVEALVTGPAGLQALLRYYIQRLPHAVKVGNQRREVVGAVLHPKPSPFIRNTL